MTAPHFTPSLHPRWPAGHANGLGGKFMPKQMAGTPLWNQQVAAAAAKHQAKQAAPATPTIKVGAAPAKAVPVVPPAPPKPPKPPKNLATRLLGPPTNTWHKNQTAGTAYRDWGVQHLKNGQMRSVQQWYVNDAQGNQHGPFGTQQAASNYYTKLTSPPGPPTPKAPPPAVPAGVTVRTAKVIKNTAAGPRNTTQYFFDYQGQSYGPFATQATMHTHIAIATKPPHPVAVGTDIIGQPPNQRPNRLADQIVASRPSTAVQRSNWNPSTVTTGSDAFYTPDAADADLRTIADLQGFSGKPDVVTMAQMNVLAKAGTHTILYRGVQSTTKASGRYSAARSGGAKTAKQIHDDLRSGTAFYGVGVYGNGYYFSPHRGTAQGYSDRTAGSVIRAALPKTAKIADYGTMTAEIRKLLGHAKANTNTKSVFADVGRYAAARGYDAINVATGIVILNRSILKVQDT